MPKLTTILEIIRPVGMNLIGFLAIPVFWSFGPLPRASSEGFLVSFTPRWRKRGGEVIFSYSFSHGIIESAPPTGVSKPSSRTFSQEGKRGTRFWTRPRGASRNTRCGTVRSNVMTPALQSLGILVSLKPTDETLWERSKYQECGN